MIDARSHLHPLVGEEIHTLTDRRANRILRVEGDDVIVGTAKSPSGRPVPIQWLQDAVDLLVREGEITVDVETLGHRGASSASFSPRCLARSLDRRRLGVWRSSKNGRVWW